MTAPRPHNRAMPVRCRLFVIALATAGFAAAPFAADLPPVTVQERVLIMPKLPAGADVPMNLPDDGAVRMPFVSGGAPGVAARINEAVWREMLDGASAPTTPGKTFTPRPDKLPRGISSLQYTARLLPAASPRLLSLGDLLTVDGFIAVGRRVDAERRRAYQAQVREWRAAVKAAPKGRKKDDADDAADRLALNEECLQQVDSQPTTPQWLVSEVFAFDGHGGLLLTRARCSNHATRALDDVDEVKVAIAAADLKGWLTPYGLAVVQQEGDAPPPAPFAGRELHGRLAGQAVTMKLEPMREGADTRGTYEYDRVHTPIALAVRQEGGEVRAFEQAGEFELTPAGGSLVGTWQDKAHRKQMPVIVQ